MTQDSSQCLLVVCLFIPGPDLTKPICVIFCKEKLLYPLIYINDKNVKPVCDLISAPTPCTAIHSSSPSFFFTTQLSLTRPTYLLLVCNDYEEKTSRVLKWQYRVREGPRPGTETL